MTARHPTAAATAYTAPRAVADPLPTADVLARIGRTDIDIKILDRQRAVLTVQVAAMRDSLTERKGQVA